MRQQQLSLWGDEGPEIPEGCSLIPDIGGTIEQNQRWANGDARPEELARLAREQLEPRWNIETIRATNGTLCWFRIIATRIEGDHVVATLQRIESPYGPRPDALDDDEEVID